MKLVLSTHNVTLTAAIEDHVVSRLNKLDHMDRHVIDARVTVEHDKTKAPERQFGCSVRLTVPGPDLFALDEEEDLYAAIDKVMKKIQQQIRKRHNKLKEKYHHAPARTKDSRREKDAEAVVES
jgi:putative sigma-54 modulation protein